MNSAQTAISLFLLFFVIAAIGVIVSALPDPNEDEDWHGKE